jgi:hypothetical protein
MRALKTSDINQLVRFMRSNNYVVYEQPYKLNIVGYRSNTTKPNSFDDFIFTFYKNKDNQWEGFESPATTDTGTYWLENPMSSKGSALLKEGQYKDVYAIDLHRGKYKAVTQRLGNVTVYRDYNRDAVLDFNNGKEETGMFGINIHRANSTGTTKTVDKNSAGCQVFANVDDFNKFMQMAEESKNRYGNKFTYTLIDERAYSRKIKRYWAYGLMASAVVILGYLAYSELKRK